VSYTLSDEDKLADAFVVVRRGKKKYFVLQF
jgi:tyrosyl-tRNA synthetase